MNPGLIGSVMNALPLDKMISSPLMAMMKAQVQASQQYAAFLLTVCIKDQKAVAVEFEYDELLVNTEGKYAGTATRRMKIPLLAAISHPNICVEEGTIDFELEVSQSEETKTTEDMEGGFKASFGWGPFKVTAHGKVSSHKESTRKTDTRAKYSIHVAAKRQPPPEALMRVIDFLTDSATKPVQIGDVTEADTLAEINVDEQKKHMGVETTA